MLTYAAHLVLRKTSRGGVIPYTIINGKVHFLLARDHKTRDLGDFGGGIKKNESCLGGSMREWVEESNGIFSISPDDILDKLAILDGTKMVIIFVPIDKSWFKNAQKEFEKKKKKNSNEISEIVWVDEDRFAMLVCGLYRYEKLWSRVQKFFMKTDVRKISDTLKNLPVTLTT
jgi:hypothetical protein